MNTKDLIKAGYRPGPQIDDMLAMIADLNSRGIISRKYIFKLLKREFGDPPPLFAMREKPASCSEAIHAENKEEKENLAKVRAKMAELLRAPIISGGALMPDACPTGPARADIPVGGVIAVENAIIPSAHSADICCSMFATFYQPRTTVEAELDALTTSTRFGPGGRHYDDLVHHPVLDEPIWENKFLKSLKERAIIHIADQGDGNHFCFIGELEITDELATQFQNAGHNLTFHAKQHGSTLTHPMVKTTGKPSSMSHAGPAPTTKPSTTASSTESELKRSKPSATNTTSSGNVARPTTTAKARPPLGKMIKTALS